MSAGHRFISVHCRSGRTLTDWDNWDHLCLMRHLTRNKLCVPVEQPEITNHLCSCFIKNDLVLSLARNLLDIGSTFDEYFQLGERGVFRHLTWTVDTKELILNVSWLSLTFLLACLLAFLKRAMMKNKSKPCTHTDSGGGGHCLWNTDSVIQAELNTTESAQWWNMARESLQQMSSRLRQTDTQLKLLVLNWFNLRISKSSSDN